MDLYFAAAGFQCDQSVAVGFDVNQIHRGRTHKGRYKQVGRLGVDLFGRAQLLDNTAVHDGDAARQRHCFNLIVGHINDGGAHVLVQALDLGAHVDSQLRVQVRQRLVEQEHQRIPNQCAAHGDALTLTAG